jgi:hypothetical protein
MNQDDLSRQIRRNQLNEVIKILANDFTLNVLAEDGVYFGMAIQEDAHEMVKILIDYFITHQVEPYPNFSYEALCLKKQLRDVLREAIEWQDLSPDMKNVLSCWISLNDDDGDEQDLTGFDELDAKLHPFVNIDLSSQGSNSLFKKLETLKM